MAAMGVCGALMKGMGTQTEAVSTEKYCSCLSGVPADMAKPYECRISPFDAFTVATGVQWCRANMPLVDPTPRPTASPTDPGPVAVEGNCYDNHENGKRCTKHKTREACITHLNVNAGGPGINPIEQICGWSVDTSQWDGQEKDNCRSKPFIKRRGWVGIADFGACQQAVEEEPADPVPVPTMPPTCGECSSHDGDKKGCKKADPVEHCVDACVWNKMNSKCQPIVCGDYSSLGMIRCDKKAKKMGATCYFDVRTDTCQGEKPDVPCAVYNSPKGSYLSGALRRKGCKKVAKKYSDGGCAWDRASRMCKNTGEQTKCDAVKQKNFCRQASGCQ